MKKEILTEILSQTLILRTLKLLLLTNWTDFYTLGICQAYEFKIIVSDLLTLMLALD